MEQFQSVLSDGTVTEEQIQRYLVFSRPAVESSVREAAAAVVLLFSWKLREVKAVISGTLRRSNNGRGQRKGN